MGGLCEEEGWWQGLRKFGGHVGNVLTLWHCKKVSDRFQSNQYMNLSLTLRYQQALFAQPKSLPLSLPRPRRLGWQDDRNSKR